MKLEQLQYFLMAAKFEHFGKAAKAIPISSSAISHTIAQLEEELGRALFVKRGKRVFLTNHGKLLVEKAKELIQHAESIKEEIQSDKIELKGHYRIGGTHFLCANYLTQAWIGIQNKNPNLSGEIFTLRSSQVIQGVLSGEYDLGLCFSPQSHPELNEKVVKTGQLLLTVGKDHPILKVKPSERISQLSQYTAVLPKAFQGVDVCERHPMFEKFGIKLKIDLLFDAYEIGMNKVAQSTSWGFFPDWLIDLHSKPLKALESPKGWNAPYSVSCIWSRNRLLSQVLKQLTQSIEELFEKE